MNGREITINARKYDGSIRRAWRAGIVSENDGLIIAVGRFDADVRHNDLGMIRAGTVSFEHFWSDRWYNVFRFHEPDGRLRNYYCNIAMPATLTNSILDFIDLDMDVVVWPDGRTEVLDRDDFAENSVKFAYPAQVTAGAERGLSDLLAMIGNGELP